LRQAASMFEAVAKRMERQTATKVRMVRFDRGSEYSGLKEWMHAEGIVAQAVPPYTPQANGRAERLNRTSLEKTRALLHQYNLPLNLWQFALQVAAYTRNLTAPKGLDESPYETFFEIKPDVRNLRIFGCLTYVLIPEEKRHSKLQKVAEIGILVGYALYSKAYKVLVSTEAGFVIRETQNVDFDESKTYDKLCAELRAFPDADVPFSGRACRQRHGCWHSEVPSLR
jgi:hypothetical protein